MLLIGSIMIKSLNILENVKKKKKINFQYFFTDKDFDDFDDTYDFEKRKLIISKGMKVQVKTFALNL